LKTFSEFSLSYWFPPTVPFFLSPFLPFQMSMSIVSVKPSARILMDLDFANTRELMASRFSRHDLQNFVDLWYFRNFGASVCIEYSGTILGFAIVFENKLEYLVMDPQFEGLGYGKILVKCVVQLLRDQGHKSVVLMTANDPTLRYWYARQGFELSSSSKDAWGIRGDTMIVRFRPTRSVTAK
jgi:GNAT superfamily N-acetyltransferase